MSQYDNNVNGSIFDYANEHGLFEAAEKFNTSYKAAYQYLYRSGLMLEMEKNIAEKMRALPHKEMGCAEIAEKLGWSISLIWKISRLYGIEMLIKDKTHDKRQQQEYNDITNYWMRRLWI